MRPSRRVILLTVVAIVCGALIVGVALIGLRTPSQIMGELEQRAFPANRALIQSNSFGVKSQRLFMSALDSPQDQRALLVSDSQATSTLSNARWEKYKSLAYGTGAERRLQREYKKLGLDAQAAGATVFGLVDTLNAQAYEAARADLVDLLERRRAIADDINARFYASRVLDLLAESRSGLSETRILILVVFAVVLVGGVGNASLLLRGALMTERIGEERDRERELNERRANLETQLQRGLEMEPNEEATYEVIGAALAEVRGDSPAELLVADSSRAHFRQVHSTDAIGRRPGCSVTSPEDCPAASSGQTRLFLSSDRLDSCPFLRNREDGAMSAACIPVSIAGQTTAVIHTTNPAHELPDAEVQEELELVARKAGDRIGYLRVLARTETQARVDALTGLFNRRSLEQQAREVLDRGESFVVAFLDLDHFKDLNDTFGHEIGDRALRLFARVLRDSVRPADIPARYGGEEFIVVLPDCRLSDARIVADRVRSRLQLGIAASTVPPFTVSIGLAAAEPPEGFADAVARADDALMQAKQGGRDRVVVAPDGPAPLQEVERT
jgi:diguanylate cyclase (GGDEF)-like protein